MQSNFLLDALVHNSFAVLDWRGVLEFDLAAFGW